MKPIEMRFKRDFDKSFVVFRENRPFFPCPWHYHPEYELVLITKSSGKRMVGDHIGYFEEGDLVCIGPKLPHVWVNDEIYLNGQADSLADAVVIHFVDDFLGEGFFNIPEMDSFVKFLALTKRGVAVRGKAREKIGKMMQEMLTMNGMQRLATLMSIFSTLSELTEYELLASPNFVQNNHLKCSDRFGQVREYIMRNFNRDITLPEIAAIANMAVTTFCNFFKEQYRITFIEFLTTVRVGHACKLLAENSSNVAQIAYECGFNNLANFNRQFKKIKNMTPSEYKRMLNLGDVSGNEYAPEIILRSAV